MNLQGSSATLQGGTGISLGNTGNSRALQLAPNVQPSANISLQSSVPQVGSQAVAQANNSNAQVQALLDQIKAQQAAYAPPLDLNSIYGKATQTAQTNVNPYYTKQLNDFLAQQTADKAIHQQQTQMNIQNLQDQLANTLAGNSISQARTAQDTLQNEQQIGIKADQAQQDQGTQFDQARIAQAKQLASEGLTTSGVGQGQVLQSETDRNTQESRQAADNQNQLQAQELFKNRTFEDLARSGELAKQSETKGETQTNFDLNNYIAQQGRDLSNTKDTLEKQRLSDVSQEASKQAKLLVNQFIQSIANPAQRQAAYQAYAGAF